MSNRLSRTIAASLPQSSQWASMTSTGSGKEGQRDTGMVALWCVWRPVSQALSLCFSHSTAHMTRECDRTNVSESKESVSHAAHGTDYWHGAHLSKPADFLRKIEISYPLVFATPIQKHCRKCFCIVYRTLFLVKGP